MLVRITRLGGVVTPLVLLAFGLSVTGWPLPAGAQEKVVTVLYVPVQRAEDVPESVPVRVEEYLRALLEIETGKLRVVHLPPEAEPAPVAAPAPAVEAPKPAPAVEAPKANPALEKASKAANAGIEAAKARKFEKALTTLMGARDQYQGQLAVLEDFNRFLDVLTWIAVAFLEGGYNEEGADAVNTVVTLNPGVSVDPAEFGNRFAKAVEVAKGRVKTGDLKVEADPAEATVYVDGRLAGQGTQTVKGLPRGRHYVRVVADGYTPQSKTVTVAVGKEAAAKIALKSKAPIPKKEKKVEVAPITPAKPLQWYARTGEYLSPTFVKQAKTLAEKNLADYVLFGYIARSDAAFQLGLFLFDARSGELASVEPAQIDTDLGNLQIALMDLEARLMKAVGAFPKDRLVRVKPPIYQLVARPRTAPAPVAVTPAPAPAPAPSPAPVAVQPSPAPAPAPAPVAVPTQAGPVGGFEDIPADFPMEQYTGRPAEEPVYKKWWLWTIVGVVVAGGVGAAVGLTVGKKSSGGETVTGSWTLAR